MAKKATVKAKEVLAGAAEAVSGALGDAAESAKTHVVLPAVEAVGIIGAAPKKKVPAKKAAASTTKPAAKATRAAPAPKKSTAAKAATKGAPAPKSPPAKGAQARAKGKK